MHVMQDLKCNQNIVCKQSSQNKGTLCFRYHGGQHFFEMINKHLRDEFIYDITQTNGLVLRNLSRFLVLEMSVT